MHFKDPTAMLPSELTLYALELQAEITRLNEIQANANKPDLFLAEDSAHATEEDMLKSMEIGDVVEALCVKKIEQSFLVKVKKDRIDRCETRIQAEHIAMLHSV